MIAVSNLVKRHADSLILNGVSLDVNKGEVAAIIGPSGGGKSTLLRCINALESFEDGVIRVDDITLEANGKAHTSKQLLMKLRGKIGMVFQQFNLFPHMNALQNVMSGPIYALGQSRAQAEPEARELLKRVGLAEKANSRPDQLSGGQQQRVAIARALAVNPAAILFDEPTSALDPKMADEVMGVIVDLAKSGQTMIVVTHAMHFARRVSHHVHVMSAGIVAEHGPSEQVFADPRHEVTREFLKQART